MLDWLRDKRVLDLALASDGPTYVYHGPTLDAAARALQAVSSVDRWFYAQKANSHARVLSRLAGHGFGLECVSAGELSAASGLGAPLLFTPNFAPRNEYALAYDLGATVTVDALHPLERWGDLFAGRALMLRFDLGVGRGHHRHVRTAGDDAKFGLSPDDAPRARAAADRVGARIVGLHAHSGSGIFDPAAWTQDFEGLFELSRGFPDVEHFDLGGGLGVPYGAGRALDLAALDTTLRALRPRLGERKLWMEPGRFLVATAGALLLKVTQIKDKGGRRFVGVDGGMNALIRPALYGARHPIFCLSRKSRPAARVTVVGPCCESADVLGWNVSLPAGLDEGDVLAVTHAGAYGFTMASRYNLREVGEVFLED